MAALIAFTVDPDVFGGRPCVRGLRVRARNIRDMLAAGATSAEILADFPYLEADDIGAAHEYAGQHIDHIARPSGSHHE